MVVDHARSLGEPPVAHLRENRALARNAVGQNHIEGRKPVRRDEQEGIAEIEDLADFARCQVNWRRPET
jgi:hypothetical protein